MTTKNKQRQKQEARWLRASCLVAVLVVGGACWWCLLVVVLVGLAGVFFVAGWSWGRAGSWSGGCCSGGWCWSWTGCWGGSWPRSFSGALSRCWSRARGLFYAGLGGWSGSLGLGSGALLDFGASLWLRGSGMLLLWLRTSLWLRGSRVLRHFGVLLLLGLTKAGALLLGRRAGALLCWHVALRLVGSSGASGFGGWTARLGCSGTTCRGCGVEGLSFAGADGLADGGWRFGYALGCSCGAGEGCLCGAAVVFRVEVAAVGGGLLAELGLSGYGAGVAFMHGS